MRIKLSLLALTLFALPLSAFACEPTSIYAAASTKDALTKIAAEFESDTGCKIDMVFAGSSTLAKQIGAGAPAQLFLSANESWMDKLAGQKLIDTKSRKDLLGNELVLIAPAGEPLTFAFTKGADLQAKLGDGKLALADPDAVPAGIYAKQSLTTLGMWDGVSRQIVAAEDVRAALAWVERGEARAGIVYRTDARIAKNVTIVVALPEDSHEAVNYPVALVMDAKTAPTQTAKQFLSYLSSTKSSEVFADFGFKPLSMPTN